MSGKRIVKEQSIYDWAIKNGLKTVGQVAKAMKGKKVRCIGSMSGHNYPTKFKVEGQIDAYIGSNGGITKTYMFGAISPGRNTIYLNEMAWDTQGKEDIVNEIKETEAYLNSLKSKISVMDELGITEYDEKLLNVISGLDAVRKSKSKDKLAEAKKFLAVIEES